MKMSRWFAAVVLTLSGLGPATLALAQNQVVSVAILNFQDDSGSNAAPELGQKLARDVQQKLLAYKDVLPRMIGSDGRALTVEQMVALGRENGARFVVRGGLLAAALEPLPSKNRVAVQLYVEVVSVDAGNLVTTLRGEGAATQADPLTPVSAVDPGSEQFRTSAMGLAFAAAISQLADAIHQSITTPVAVAEGQPPPSAGAQTAVAETTPAPAEATNVAEADADLQQLIAQAESILSAGANASTERIAALTQSLEGLRSALAAKASLMEGGGDTAQADRDLASRKEALQSAVAQVTAEVTSQDATSSAAVQEPSGEKKSLLASVDDVANQALAILQKIQEIRSTLRGAQESAAHEATPQTTTGEAVAPAGPPTEEPVGEGSGVVVDEHSNPVEGAQVTDQQSGASTTTDSHGVYRLQGLLSGRMANLLVTKGPMKSSAQVEVWPGRPAVLDFQLKPLSAGRMPGFRVLPSTVAVSTTAGSVANNGVVTGVVRDAQGRVAPRALVTLKGLGVARTNSQGQYTFLNVPAGAHELIVNQSGLQSRTAQVQVAARKSTDAKIQFSPGDRVPVALNRTSLLLPGSGTLVTGTVVDDQSHPIAGAKVSAVQESSAIAVFTGSGGTFELRNLKPGPYRIIVSKPGYDSASQNASLRSAARERRDFQLKKRSLQLPSDTRLSPRPQIVRSGGVDGQVTDATTGRAISGATISIQGKRGVSADAGGRFVITDLPPGIYQVTAGKVGYSSDQRSIAVRSGETTRLSFRLTPIKPSGKR